MKHMHIFQKHRNKSNNAEWSSNLAQNCSDYLAFCKTFYKTGIPK